ncbi:MAG: HPr family phosphocarrier protein [Acidobacteriota bacterium]|nr:HPr family phosphocarrier protein [Acidobacteriota bacterium]
MISREVEIVNRLGLHARAAAKFVHLAARFESNILVARDSQEVNGKSILGLLLLAATSGIQLRISADGADENEAIAALSEFVSKRFGEKT